MIPPVTRREFLSRSLRFAATAALVPTLAPCGRSRARQPRDKSVVTPWTPPKSGYRIAFDSDRDGNIEIYAMDQDGSHQQRLTHTAGKGKYNMAAAWSPDRRKIAFCSTRDGRNEQIYVMDADGSNVRRLTQTVSESRNSAWSPEGRKIAFDSNRDGKWEIYMMEADGSNVRRLTQTPGEGSGSGNPDWSPDGKKIAFASTPRWEDEMVGEIYVMEGDGSHVQRLTSTPGRGNWTPRWSPDGKRIAFTSNRHGNPQNANASEIYVISADGSDV